MSARQADSARYGYFSRVTRAIFRLYEINIVKSGFLHRMAHYKSQAIFYACYAS